MATYTAQSYSISPVQVVKKRGAVRPLANLVTQGRTKYSKVLAASNIVNSLSRRANAPKPATWPAQSFSLEANINSSSRRANAPKPANWAAKLFYSEGGGSGGVTSDEFPTVYGYL